MSDDGVAWDIGGLLTPHTETSKRLAIHKREKVKKRVKETKRKKGKEAKKNPQWKSSASLVFLSLAVARVGGGLSLMLMSGRGHRAREGPGHPEQLSVQGPDPRRGRGAASSGTCDVRMCCLSGVDGRGG